MSDSKHYDWKTRVVEWAFPDRSFEIEILAKAGGRGDLSAAWDAGTGRRT